MYYSVRSILSIFFHPLPRVGQRGRWPMESGEQEEEQVGRRKFKGDRCPIPLPAICTFVPAQQSRAVADLGYNDGFCGQIQICSGSPKVFLSMPTPTKKAVLIKVTRITQPCKCTSRQNNIDLPDVTLVCADDSKV